VKRVGVGIEASAAEDNERHLRGRRRVIQSAHRLDSSFGECVPVDVVRQVHRAMADLPRDVVDVLAQPSQQRDVAVPDRVPAHPASVEAQLLEHRH